MWKIGQCSETKYTYIQDNKVFIWSLFRVKKDLLLHKILRLAAFVDFSLFLSINKYLCAVRENTVIHSYDMKVLCAVLCTFILFKVKKYSLKTIFAPTKNYWMQIAYHVSKFWVL